MKKIFFTIIAFISFFFGHAQQSTLKGKVVNEKGEPIPFISISIKNSSGVAISDDNGEFIIKNISDSDILTLSGFGYMSLEYKPALNGETVLVRLKHNVKELQEVEIVSSGYEEIPKERATGSFVKIDNVTLSQQTGTNILSRLDGVTSGLLLNIGKQNNNPQNKTNISIRGLSTINGGLDPLIVIDGFIYEGDINNINPDDVDNVTILKDAAAASIWGARAGNGVIIITSKKGRFNQKLKIGINTNVTVSGKPDLLYLPAIASSDLIDIEQTLFNNGYFDDRINWEPYLSVTPAVEIFEKRRNGLISPADSASMINKLKTIDTRKEYTKFFYTNPFTQQYSVNVRGGSNVNAYSFSVGYDRSLNETYNKLRKLNIKMDNVFKPSKNIQISVWVYYTNSKSQSGRDISYTNSIQQGGRQAPYIRFSDDSGNPISVPSTYSDAFIDTLGGGKLLNWKYYPLEDYKYQRATGNLQEIFSNIGLTYKLFEGFGIDLKYQYQDQQSENIQLYTLESFAARDLINSFTQLDRATGVVNYVVPYGGIRTLGMLSTRSKTIRGQLNFNRQWRNSEIAMIAGDEIREVKDKSNFNTLYGYNDDPLTFTNVDPVNSYPTIMFGNYSYIPLQNSVSEFVNRFVSLYANASYTLSKKYTVSASARKDGSNIYGVNTNDKWKPLWSVGGSWKISDEQFFRSKLFPQIKLRATYGLSGNVDLSKSAVAVGAYYSGTSPTNFPYTRINTLNNPELRWEKVRIFNAGVEFSTKGSIISGSIDYYQKKGADLYGPFPYDYTTWGFTSTIIKNGANISGKGVDLVINSKNINKNFRWSTTFLLNYNTDKAIKYESSSAGNINSLISGGQIIIPVIGKPLYAIAAYKWGGLDNEGNPQGYVNGKLSTDYQAIFKEGNDKGLDGNIVYVGPCSPTVFGSLINTFSLKRLTLSANISYKFGYYFQKPSLSYASVISTGSSYGEFNKRWQKPGDEQFTNVPSFVYPNNSDRDNFYASSEINVLRGEHIRLQYVNLTYSIITGSGKSPGFSKVQVYTNAANLGLIWKSNKAGLDPDYPYSMPPVKSLTFGIRANF